MPRHASVTVLRGLEESAYGDEIDSPSYVATGISISIVSRTSFRPNTARPFGASTGESGRISEVVRHTGWVANSIDIRSGDRIRDERTKVVYVVDMVSVSLLPGNRLRLALRLFS